MYIIEYNAFVVIQSKSKTPERTVPAISFDDIKCARYILFNHQTKLTSPLELFVYKCRVDLVKTDFWAHLLDFFPSITYISSDYIRNHKVSISDDSDIVRFLLLYGDS